MADDAASLDAGQRSVLRGAIEYFLLTTDTENDVTSPNGLRDDARVFNLVVAEIGRPELAIELPGP